MSAEALMRPEGAVCVRVMHGYARRRQGQYMLCICTAIRKLNMQTKVVKKHLWFKFQQVHGNVRRYVLEIHISDIFWDTFRRHPGMQALSAQRTCHVVRQKVQRQRTRTELVLARQLDAIVAVGTYHPFCRHSVYFDLCACNIEYAAFDTPVCRMQYHSELLIFDALEGDRYC
jgi:hypothetical protein